MLRIIVLRVASGCVTLLAASVLIFATMEVLPGDAATAFLGQEAQRQGAVTRLQFGLDRPAPIRYGEWILRVAHGDFGRSVANGVPVTQLIGQRLLSSSILVGITLALLLPLGLGVGTLAGLRPGSRIDAMVQLASLATVVLPEFVVGIALIIVFADALHLLPAVSLSISFTSLILPVITLLTISTAYTARMVRAGVIDVLRSEFVEMARLKGLPEHLVIMRHVLPNALVPAAQAFALTAAWMSGGIVIVETLFGYAGIGQGLVEAVSARDTATVEALCLILAAVYLVTNLAADVFAFAVTPRLRTRWS